MDVLICFLVIVMLIIGFVNWSKDSWYNSRSHSSVSESTRLRADAKIIDVKSERVGYKNNAAIRTTVTFDDGFSYISHDSERDVHLLSYTLTVSKEVLNKILHDAVAAHQAALSGK